MDFFFVDTKIFRNNTNQKFMEMDAVLKLSMGIYIYLGINYYFNTFYYFGRVCSMFIVFFLLSIVSLVRFLIIKYYLSHDLNNGCRSKNVALSFRIF